jgi:hypothetical protein
MVFLLLKYIDLGRFGLRSYTPQGERITPLRGRW